MVADFHRNMMYGGIYMYPADKKNPDKANGKLRLLCEAAPMAFIAEQAGGRASDGHKNILDIETDYIHQRVPIYIGNKENVDSVEDYIQGKRT